MGWVKKVYITDKIENHLQYQNTKATRNVLNKWPVLLKRVFPSRS